VSVYLNTTASKLGQVEPRYEVDHDNALDDKDAEQSI
jgi:hypothetical protein